jgi:hypothetical protein
MTRHIPDAAIRRFLLWGLQTESHDPMFSTLASCCGGLGYKSVTANTLPWLGSSNTVRSRYGRAVAIPCVTFPFIDLSTIQNYAVWDADRVLNPSRAKRNLVKASSRTAQYTHSISVIKTSQLMLYRQIIAVSSQIHTKHINTLCGQNVILLNVKLIVHRVTTGLIIGKFTLPIS